MRRSKHLTFRSAIVVEGLEQRQFLAATPTGVDIGAVSFGNVDIFWDDVSGETGYRVYRSTTGFTGRHLRPTCFPTLLRQPTTRMRGSSTTTASYHLRMEWSRRPQPS
jgi:hypothetical protein